MLFTNLGLIDPLLRAIKDEGYTEATPIQAQAIPHVIAGRDLLGLAQTGTGKTAAFALPILQRLAGSERKGKGSIRVLIITPTRELASQIAESFAAYGRHLRFTHTVVFGGVGQRPQEDALRRGVDVLVATPGRLLDLMGQGFVKLADLEVFVLDEADRMLDMGFIPDVKRIIAALPTKRQTLFFSATMPPAAQQLADRLLHNPVKVAVVPPSTTVEKVSQSVYFVPKEKKRSLLIHLVGDKSISRALVFTRTKHGANRVAEGLVRAGVESEAIHGNKSQSARERALAGFKSGRVRVLVATDIAARGIDVDEVSHVINFDLPNIPESYVHRIGRTARAGASGIAISFCDDGEERVFLRDIEREIRSKIPISVTPPLAAGPAEPDRPRGDRGGRSSQRGGGGGGGYGGGGGRGGSGRGGSRGNAPARASSGGGGGGGASSDRAPTRLARPEGAGGSDPSWSRFSYSSTSTPAAPRPSGGGKKRGSGGGGRSGGGSHRGR